MHLNETCLLQKNLVSSFGNLNLVTCNRMTFALWREQKPLLGFGCSARLSLPWSHRLSFNIIFCYLEICDAKHWSKRRAERKESRWSRSLRIWLSCWLSTWQLSKMSFSFDQSHSQRYLIHPIIWLVEQLKISSNQKWRSKADGMKVRITTVLTRDFLFSALSASCQKKIKDQRVAS